MEYVELRDRIKEIIESLGWYETTTCPDDGSSVRYSVVDSGTTTGAICPRCQHQVIGGDLRYGTGEPYRDFFQDAIAVCLTIGRDESFLGNSVPLILAHTSLEVFLRGIVSQALGEKGVDEAVAQFLSDKADMKSYGELLDRLGIKVKGRKEWEALREVSAMRNDAVHRGMSPNDEKLLLVFRRVAEIFRSLAGSHISSGSGIPLEEAES